MKNDITEKVLEIINVNINVPDHLGTKICGQKSAAKEISALFEGMYSRKFVEWKDKNCVGVHIWFSSEPQYIIKENTDGENYTINQLNQHWQNLPENKETNIKEE